MKVEMKRRVLLLGIVAFFLIVALVMANDPEPERRDDDGII